MTSGLNSSCCGHSHAANKISVHSLHTHECTDLSSAFWLWPVQEEFAQECHGAFAHNTYMLVSKVIGRAGRRRGYGRRGHEGRTQPRAVWAMPRPVERAPASDGAVIAREARIGVSLSSTLHK